MIRVSQSQIAVTSSSTMSGPNSPDLNPLDYQVWKNAGVLSQAAIEGKTVSKFKDGFKLIWSAVPEKPFSV